MALLLNDIQTPKQCLKIMKQKSNSTSNTSTLFVNQRLLDALRILYDFITIIMNDASNIYNKNE